MNLVRKLKLSRLGIDNLSDTEKGIINFVKDKISNLSEFTHEKFQGWIYYMNSDNKMVFKYNTEKRHLSIRYQGLWEVLQNKYKLEYSDIQYIIEYIAESYYKLNIVSTLFAVVSRHPPIETYYKSKLTD